MFNSDIIDVVIGMVLVYLLLSLIASGVNEVISSLLRWRARDLEEALKELLETGLTTQFYKHGLVQSLTVRYSLWEKILQKLSGGKTPAYRRPSYIPSHTFALTLLDAIPSYIKTLPVNAETDAAKAALASWIENAPSLPPPGSDPAAIAAANAAASATALANLKTMVEGAKPLLPADLYQSLSAIVNDRTVSGIGDAITKIENWFDDMMQRVSSLYKSKVQHFLLVIGAVVSVFMNADSVMIGNVLWHNGPLRDSVVAAAQEIAKENVLSPLPSSSGVITPTPVLSGSLGLSGLPLIEQVITETKNLQLPLGWNQNPQDTAGDPTAVPRNATDWLLKLLGLIATTIAISLGAPFWFDLLSKVVNVRSALKPPSTASSPPKSSSS